MKIIHRFFVALLLLVVLTLAGNAIAEDPADIYTEANRLMGLGKYTEAATLFDSISAYADSSQLSLYCKACQMCESGMYNFGLPAFEQLGDFKDSKLRYNYYEARMIEYGSKLPDVDEKEYGYINTTGEVVIELHWDYAESFSDGVALVYKDDKSGYIDTTGKVIIGFGVAPEFPLQ